MARTTSQPEAQQTMPIDPPADEIIVADEVQAAPRGARPQRQGARTASPSAGPRDPSRSGVVVFGRDGEELSRSVNVTGDPFNIPEEMIPSGWAYQWNVVSVVGNADVVRRHSLTMYGQGWRPVPAKRHPGMFTPHGFDGDIVVEGQRLEERPTALSDEAREQDYAKAFAQMRDRDEALMGGKANLRSTNRNGFELNPRRAQQKGMKPRLSIDPAYDIPAPAHLPADDSIP